ncbi:hypothetical protein [Amycolatopsis sp. CA-230715]|uniref:hypothetical protein n=1 Tax=Amycolatopsis sp. CA-230715 TaxID=2745196 RepID=UPI001C01BF97|nr:hypothetical protein [Amycolatopsis sp. CA-230715]QWF78738.1 hypothetical protein HUW46_02136 [Amycolatopsis sp. CA-230715]
MSELQRVDAHQQVSRPQHEVTAPTTLDQWVLVVRDVSKLATQIADTPFVPEGMRGNPAAVTAAILTGREMGLGPMTSLQHIHVVKGKPGKSAEIMRGMALAAGHHLRDVEVTDTRVVLEGRRRDEETWTRVTFTADQARRAKIDLGGYPEDKLYARATTRLCRRKFADVVGGIALTVDELEDADDLDPARATLTAPPGPAEPQAPQPAKRTAKRRTAPKNGAPKAKVTPTDSSPPDPTAEPDRAAPPPSLPGDDDHPATPDPTDASGDDAGEAPATRSQLDKLHAQLGDLDVDARGDKLTVVGQLVQRTLTSSNDLTKLEATQAIDILARVLDSDEPKRTLDAVLGELES